MVVQTWRELFSKSFTYWVGYWWAILIGYFISWLNLSKVLDLTSAGLPVSFVVAAFLQGILILVLIGVVPLIGLAFYSVLKAGYLEIEEKSQKRSKAIKAQLKDPQYSPKDRFNFKKYLKGFK